MEISVPCEAFARITSILNYLPEMTPQALPWFRSVRVEDGMLICTNRQFIVVERVFGMQVPAPFHIDAHPTLIEACKKEGAYGSKLHIVVNEPLKWTSAKTTLGYNYPGNAGVWSDFANDVARWRETLPTEPATKSSGGMFFDALQIYNLCESSPSQKIAFPEHIDVDKPCLVRDIHDDTWFAVFMPRPRGPVHVPAVYPSWWRDVL